MDNTILVVEDDPELQEVLTLNLQNAGYRVLRAGSIRQAEALLNGTLPQMVLLDLAMHGEDRYALHERLTAGRDTIPAVAVSPHGRPGNRAHALASGFRNYIQKPVHARELIRAVRSIASEVRE